MTEITAQIAVATTLFTAIVTLAVVVVGFFKGRAWFKRL